MRDYKMIRNGATGRARVIEPLSNEPLCVSTLRVRARARALAEEIVKSRIAGTDGLIARAPVKGLIIR